MNENGSTIFLQPTDKDKIANIISSLKSNKVSGPNSITYSILLLLKKGVRRQLADLFNLSFRTGVLPSILTTAKVVPVLKKDSKLDYSNYHLISLIPFLTTIILSIIYSLNSDKNIPHLMP